jgi:alpha-L-fucosidase 2
LWFSFFGQLIWASAGRQTLVSAVSKTMEETLPLGNGKIGMMPDGGLKNDHIVLNDITLWSGSPQDANNYEASRYLDSIRNLIKSGKTTLLSV